MAQRKSALRWATVALAVTTWACDRGADTTARDRDADATPGAEATTGERRDGGTERVADIVGNPSEHIGKQVTVVADVEEVFGPYAFALDEDAPLAGGVDRDLLVLSQKQAHLANIDDQWVNNKVRVTGTVGRVSLVEVEREVGWDLNPEIEAELEGAGAVLIATSVERVKE